MTSIIDQAFAQQLALTTKLQNSGSFRQYMAEHEVVPADLRVPSKRNGHVGCVDEGISHLHLPADKLHRHPDLHHALALYMPDFFVDFLAVVFAVGANKITI